MSDGAGRPVLPLGHDPVACFPRGRPARGDPSIRVDLPYGSHGFARAEHRTMFEREPARYEPQHGGFRASGAAFAIELGSDPTSWAIREGRLSVFGDVLGQTVGSLDAQWNVDHADRPWPSIRERGWRAAEGFGQPALGYPRSAGTPVAYFLAFASATAFASSSPLL